MITTTVNKKEQSITVETDFDFSEFKVDKFREYFHLNFKIDKLNSSGCALFFKDFNGRKYYPKDIQIYFIDESARKIVLTYTR